LVVVRHAHGVLRYGEIDSLRHVELIYFRRFKDMSSVNSQDSVN